MVIASQTRIDGSQHRGSLVAVVLVTVGRYDTT
jgi:hypothetical protein